MTDLLGVDYSATPPGAAALTAAGVAFACRYLADDARGLTIPEREDLAANGVEIVVVYESTETRWEGGEVAGIFDATYAANKQRALGLPERMPIYFAVDYDAAPGDQSVIDSYLRGCAEVIGLERVGMYGGYWDLMRADQDGAATWLWQTTAWSGGNLYAGAHLYQDAYNWEINGTNCDKTVALAPVYGQASAFAGALPPAPAPAPVYAKARKIARATPTCVPYAGAVTSVLPYTPRQVASLKGRPTGAQVAPGTVVHPVYFLIAADGSGWFVTGGGSRHPASAFFPTRTA